MQQIDYNALPIVVEELNDFCDRVVNNIIAADANVTGETIASIQSEVLNAESAIKGIVSGRPYFAALETGTKPWSVQYLRPPKFFVDIIREWIDHRGLDLSAGAVAYTIMRDGSLLYRDGGRTNIYSQEIPTTLNNIERRLADFFVTNINERLDQIIKTEP